MRPRTLAVFVFIFLLAIVASIYGNEGININITENQSAIFSCVFKDITPQIKIEVGDLEIRRDNGLEPYALFIIYNFNGTIIGNITLFGNLKKGYFYFEKGFLVYAWSGELSMAFYNYNLTRKWQIWRTGLNQEYSEYYLLEIFRDDSHVFLLSAYRNPITNELKYYCLEWGNVERGDIKSRFCSDKELSNLNAFSGKILGDKVYILSNKGVYVFTYTGKLIKKKKIELSKIKSFDVNEKYLAFAYPGGDNTSKLCVLTSNLKSQKCISIEGQVEQLKLCGNYLLLKTENKVKTFKIEENP